MIDYNSLNDKDLLEKISASDIKAFEILYDKYSSFLYTLIRKIINDSSTAEETLSEVFEIIWRKAELYNLDSDNGYTWLITLTRNKAIDKLKRENGLINEKYTAEYEDKFIVPKLSSEIKNMDLQTALNNKTNFESALNNLTDAQKYVIYLAFYEGLKYKDIAKKLNIPAQTVKSKIKMAMKNLKGNFIKEGK